MPIAPLSRRVACLAVTALAACATPPVQHRAGVLEYLYPEGKPASPPSDVRLDLPLRVGIAFAPETGQSWSPILTESQKQRVLARLVGAFTGVEGVEKIEPIPSAYVKLAGGFENVDQLRSLLGIDLIAIVSYEQTQFSDMNKLSLTYWTIVGGYFIEGNENETHTFVDTSVFDIGSRALLFNAGGRSKIEETSTALEQSEAMREDSARGFDKAVEQMVSELQSALSAFREQAKLGTVRGAGTPAVQVSGRTGPGGGGSGAGAAGGLELALGLLLCAGFLARRGLRAA